MQKFALDSVEMTWNPDVRIGTVHFGSGAKPSHRDGTLLVEAMTRWIGTDLKPFAILGDGEKIIGGEPGYRSVMAGFFHSQREKAYLALYNLSPELKVASQMFATGTGMRFGAFSSEGEARAWLRSAGFDS
jgi:hypothetical protein